MNPWNKVAAHLAWAGLVVASFPGVGLCQQSTQLRATGKKSAVTIQPEVLPDSPGTVRAAMTAKEIAAAFPPQEPQSSSQSQNQTPPPPPVQNPNQPPQKPVGTAAAEAPGTSGLAASEPSGAAIAPAKQHRARTLIIKVGALVGAGIAVGTIAALTMATPSKPPGAH